MMLFSVGLPGRFAAWCDAAVARLAGEAAVVGAESPDEVAGALVRSVEPNLVITARCPTPALRTLLIDGDCDEVRSCGQQRSTRPKVARILQPGRIKRIEQGAGR